MSQILSKIKDDFQVVFSCFMGHPVTRLSYELLSCFVGHPVTKLSYELLSCFVGHPVTKLSYKLIFSKVKDVDKN